MRLSSYEWQVIIVILRKTYGWKKPHDRISLSQIFSLTGIPIPHASRTVRKLIKKRIVTRIGNTIPQILAIQKDYEKYLPKQRVTQTGNKELPKQVTKGLPKQVTTKETIQKKRKQTRARASIYNNNNNIYKASIDAVFAYFCEKTETALTKSKERVKIIHSCLEQGRTVDQCKTAINNFSNDDWADRHKFCDIVYCLGIRNKIDNFEKWVNYKKISHKPKSVFNGRQL